MMSNQPPLFTQHEPGLPCPVCSPMVEAMHSAVDDIGDYLGSYEHMRPLCLDDLTRAMQTLEEAISNYYDTLRKEGTHERKVR